MFESLQYFLSKIAMSDMETVAELFRKKGHADFFTPKEKDDFNRLIYKIAVCEKNQFLKIGST